MESKAYSSERVSDWLDLSVEIKGPFYGTLIGAQKPKTLTARAAFDSIRDWDRFETASRLDEAGLFFELPSSWWKRDQYNELDLECLSALLVDGWLYLCWLRKSGSQSESRLYLLFLQKTLTHPKLKDALWIMGLYHYSSTGSNFWDVMPNHRDFVFSAERAKSIWGFNPSNPMTTKGPTRGYQRANDSFNFLMTIFKADENDKATIIREGLEHITSASLHEDRLFFEKLGQVLETPIKSDRRMTLEQLIERPMVSLKNRTQTPTKTPTKTPRVWARRLWISRGFWLMPSSQVQSKPLLVNPKTREKLTRDRYLSGHENPDNDSLHSSESPWFSDSTHRAGEALLPFTAEGKKAFPELGDHGFPWEVLTKDLV